MADEIIIPKVSVIKLLELMLGKDLAENMTVHLFTNSDAIDEDTVIGDFTEMSTLGYVAKTLTMATWDTPTIESTYAKSEYNGGTAVEWTFTTGTEVSVYGYYIRMATTSEILTACKFASAKPISTAGEKIQIVPEFRLPYDGS